MCASCKNCTKIKGWIVCAVTGEDMPLVVWDKETCEDYVIVGGSDSSKK